MFVSPDLTLVTVAAVSMAVFLGQRRPRSLRRLETFDEFVTTKRRRRRQQKQAPIPVAVALDLVAAALDTGVPPATAVRVVAQVLAEASDPTAEVLAEAVPGAARSSFEGQESSADSLRRAFQLAEVAGIAPASLVRSSAEQERRRRLGAQTIAARKLSVYSVVPLAVCLLPAFLLLSVIPVVLDLVTHL
jgi:tight adherence protein B